MLVKQVAALQAQKCQVHMITTNLETEKLLQLVSSEAMPFLFLERTNITGRQYIELSLPSTIYTSFDGLPCVIMYLFF